MPFMPSDEKLDRSFRCPSCGVFSVQRASPLSIYSFAKLEPALLGERRLHFLDCDNCGSRLLFASADLIFPEPLHGIDEPNPDLSEDAKCDYREAASILRRSPRGACALLRLALMKLMQQLQLSGELNEDIKKLVADGLADEVQQACDALRVVGNGAVHPGLLDLKDNVETATQLFELINFIADQTITQPKRRAKFFDLTVPDRDKAKIAKRDGKPPRTTP